MSSFTKAPRLETIPPEYKLYKVVKAFEYHIGSEASPEVIKIPQGFITDGASIPKPFWSVIGGPLGRYAPAAVVHDFLYIKQTYSRKKSDGIFLEAMKILKVSWWKRRSMWLAVRMWSWIPWRKYKKVKEGFVD